MSTILNIARDGKTLDFQPLNERRFIFFFRNKKLSSTHSNDSTRTASSHPSHLINMIFIQSAMTLGKKEAEKSRK